MSLKLFEEYIKFYLPDFCLESNSKYEFCDGMDCRECKIKIKCGVETNNLIPYLSEDEIQDIKEYNPEYFL